MFPKRDLSGTSWWLQSRFKIAARCGVMFLQCGFLLLAPTLGAAQPWVLFNGKDFTGWTFDIIDPKTAPETIWMVENGIIISKGRPPGLMRSVGDFANYELIVEWRWAPETKPGNAGILLHASTPREIYAWPKSIEVQLAAGNAGDFWMIGEEIEVPGTTLVGRRFPKKAASTEKPPGEWNTARILSVEGKISVWINGTLMNKGTCAVARTGAICLQSEGGEIHFRKIEVTPAE